MHYSRQSRWKGRRRGDAGRQGKTLPGVAKRPPTLFSNSRTGGARRVYSRCLLISVRAFFPSAVFKGTRTDARRGTHEWLVLSRRRAVDLTAIPIERVLPRRKSKTTTFRLSRCNSPSPKEERKIGAGAAAVAISIVSR